ncbi:MAG: exodeoxyribonuclease V subunit alpha [Gammaproteobacteria bacterium]|nr:exodeoxyribonuclease V subunit alpha [Gammaproteobacteria bacterium]
MTYISNLDKTHVWVAFFQRLNPQISPIVLFLVEQLVLATEQGLTKLYLSNIDYEHPLTLDAVHRQLEVCPQVRLLHREDNDSGQPLVWVIEDGHSILYWRRYYLSEKLVLEQISFRATTPSNFVADPSVLETLLPHQTPPSTNFWQAVACALALRRQFCVITGGPGSGKTYTAGIFIAYLLHQKPTLQFALAAPTGKAASHLQASIERNLGTTGTYNLEKNLYSGKALTIHRLLGAQSNSLRLRYHAKNQLELDLLIVDEASMVDLVMLQALLNALPMTCQFILLGDKDQLASVLPGSIFSLICQLALQTKYLPSTQSYLQKPFGLTLPEDRCSDIGKEDFGQQFVALQTNHRSIGQVIKLAQAVLHHEEARAHFNPSNSSLNYFPSLKMATLLDYVLSPHLPSWKTYFSLLQNLGNPNLHAEVGQLLSSLKQFCILCAVHQGPAGTEHINQSLEPLLQKKYHLEKLNAEWIHGTPAMVTKNQADLELFNGDSGIVLRNPDGKPMFWYLRELHARCVPLNRVQHILKKAYAYSVHKAQGQEYSHTLLILPPNDQAILTRELIYTAITRAKTHFTLIECSPGVLELAIERYGKSWVRN